MNRVALAAAAALTTAPASAGVVYETSGTAVGLVRIMPYGGSLNHRQNVPTLVDGVTFTAEITLEGEFLDQLKVQGLIGFDDDYYENGEPIGGSTGFIEVDAQQITANFWTFSTTSVDTIVVRSPTFYDEVRSALFGMWVVPKGNNFNTAFSYRMTIANAVPEPSTWALMMAGFALAGAAARRQRLSFA